jgi:hypothetical protein
VNDGNHDSAWPHAGADGEEQIALQVAAIANQVEGVWLDIELVLLEVRQARVHLQTPLPGPIPNQVNRHA